MRIIYEKLYLPVLCNIKWTWSGIKQYANNHSAGQCLLLWPVAPGWHGVLLAMPCVAVKQFAAVEFQFAPDVLEALFKHALNAL